MDYIRLNRLQGDLRIARRRIQTYAQAGYQSEALSRLQYQLRRLGLDKLPTSKRFIKSEAFQSIAAELQDVVQIPTVPSLENKLTELQRRLVKGGILEQGQIDEIGLSDLYDFLRSEEYSYSVKQIMSSGDVVADAVEMAEQGSLRKFRDALIDYQRNNGSYADALKAVGKRLRP